MMLVLLESEDLEILAELQTLGLCFENVDLTSIKDDDVDSAACVQQHKDCACSGKAPSVQSTLQKSLSD